MEFSNFLEQFGKTTSVGPKTHVFRQGDSLTKFVFVKKGLLKAYYLSYEGKEFIKSFIGENEIMGSVRATYEQCPSPFSLVTLEASELIQFDIDPLREAASAHLEIAKTVVDVLMKLASKKEKREYEFLVMSAEDRYTAFKDSNPDLINRVTQNDIARYLGITPIALSRIRRRLTTKQEIIRK